jgi:UDP-3-O-[3-hydroxymyristoyl] glucosamine N-acyltransferase
VGGLVKLKKLAELVGGEISGNPEIVIRRVSALAEAAFGDLVFILENRNLAPALQSPAAAVVAGKALKGKLKNKTALLVDNPRLALAKILTFLSPKPKVRPGTIHKSAVIAESAKLGKRVTIYPFVYVGEDVVIGDDTILYPSVTIMDGVQIGRRVTIHAGARIGVDGFGFVWEENSYVKIPQTGTVVIEDDAEIYANTCVARGTLGETRVGAGSKIDNLTHIAHNCVLGKNCAVTALVGFAGSVTLKDHVSVGGMAGFNGHITVGENTVILAKSGVTKDIPANSVVSGFPAINHREELEQQAAIRQLPSLHKKLKPGK